MQFHNIESLALQISWYMFYFGVFIRVGIFCQYNSNCFLQRQGFCLNLWILKCISKTLYSFNSSLTIAGNVIILVLGILNVTSITSRTMSEQKPHFGTNCNEDKFWPIFSAFLTLLKISFLFVMLLNDYWKCSSVSQRKVNFQNL